MKKRLKLGMLAAALCMVPLAGCGGNRAAQQPPMPQVALSCVGVMPVVSGMPPSAVTDLAAEKNTMHGMEVLDRLLREKFMGRDDIRFIGSARMYDIDNSDAVSFLDRAEKVAAQVSCNGVLEVTLLRYRDRVGGKYTAKEPASVAFTYRLVEVNTGTTVCRGRYDEVQKSVMENLYNFGEASKRGFVWVTAPELLKEGLDKRLDQCRALQPE